MFDSMCQLKKAFLKMKKNDPKDSVKYTNANLSLIEIAFHLLGTSKLTFHSKSPTKTL
jgi:hypothetical protein